MRYRMAMTRIHGFRPIADRRAEMLILGSMPGVASLDAGRYYAHPRNAFWPIMADLLGFDAVAPYAVRARALKVARIALWDVLASCARPGSLDAAIDPGSLQVNDFKGFFEAHPRIRRVYFNGAAAERYFRRLVSATLLPEGMALARLPSTSPANASWGYERKLAAWRVIKGDYR